MVSHTLQPCVPIISNSMSMGPTSPAVPMPLPVRVANRPSVPVPLGSSTETVPKMAEEMMGGTKRTGFLKTLGICSMEVPSPCATKPPQRFSRKLMAAKPIIWQQQPTTAAPAATPERPMEMPMAADEMGRVSATPRARQPMR